MTTDTGMVNAFVEGRADLDPATGEMISRRKDLLGPAYRLFYERPLHLVRGEGVWLYDPEGTGYLDAYNNVTSIGHCHPRVVEAIARQAGILATNTRYMHGAILDYAERLLATMPDALGHMMFTCTGSDANDLAVRIAQSFTGGKGIVVTETAYHGITQAVSEFSPSLGENVDLGAHVRTVPAPDSYRVTEGLAESFGASVAAAFADLKRHGIKPALFICDGIFASDGVFGDPAGFLKPAVEAARAAGALYIADEVQSGFGRTGDAMWGFQRHGVIPDLVTMGKPMGNGFPVAGVAVRPEVVEEFGRKARYFNTFGGNAVAIAAATAVLDVIEDEGLVENARVMGDYLRDGFRDLQTRYPAIGDVRGAGLFIGVEMVSDAAAKTPDAAAATAIVNGMRDENVLISGCAKAANVLKIRPPLVFKKSDADHFIAALSRVLARLS
ncbi:aspartate aminotransferase family protein [Pseudodonghicola flavimaris]|uniref:Aminotransferase class III-fold pyridoxal phosphate-dependent enzyme n=1 Tax=Pseudodonghicola flavimaris TaxID=3050036 RepID=A0ABT7F5I4_9RHOB|nr:aminotransferase class III-fold pyridoxal phosphate-dependent enzyme [Pseudodonghicola flavimaris]MDK3019862.1 aminotransferase class III-fold pyridoxal phosphate-dependent enzyme [Pseudodonghicola flavimaris]